MTASCKERGYQLVCREQRKDLKKFKIEKTWKLGGGGGQEVWKERESPSLFDFVLRGGIY